MAEQDTELQAKGFSSYVPVVATCMVLCGVPAAMLMSCGGIFYPVIAADLGVQTASVSFYMSVMFIAAACISPLMGKLMEKYDIRIVLSGAVLIEAICFAAFSVFNQVWEFWIAGAFLGICNTALLSLSTPTIINRWFAQKVGLLVGLCFAFTGIGGVVFIPIGQALIDAAGWRVAYLVYAAIILIVCLPLTIFAVRSNPSDRGMLPYGAGQAETADASGLHMSDDEYDEEPVIDEHALSVPPNVAMKSPAFWITCLFCGLVNMTISIASFFPKYVNGLNADPATAVLLTGAMLATIAMAGQAIGKIGLGMMGDLSVTKGILLSCSTGIVGVLCCWLGASTVLLPVGGFVFGFFYAAALVLSPLLTRHVFGSGKHYPVVYSRIFVFIAAFSAIGQVIWPYLADNAGGFGTVFFVSAIVIVVIAALGFWADSYAGKLEQE